ncbi:uncharacterized protein LOC144604720 [Rhinoraja longicauda]
MEAVCRRFHSYNFAADRVFERSLRQLGEASGERLLETRIRYYSRFVEPIDLGDYKRWLSSQIADQSSNFTTEEMTNAFGKLLRQTSEFPEENGDSTTVESINISHKPCPTQRTNMADAGVHVQISKEIEGKVAYKSTENSQNEQIHQNKAANYLADIATITGTKGDRFRLSFPQVLHLVQSGQEVPGIQKLNITSTNSVPTMSQLARKLKPWERI